MKINRLIALAVIFAAPVSANSQNKADTTQAQQYQEEGNTQFAAADYASSLTSFEKAALIYDTNKDWLAYVEVLIKISQNYGRLGQLEKALELGQKALKTSQDRFGESHEKYGRALYNTVKFDRHQSKLFNTSNSLDSLTHIFEQNYPKYFQLKYLATPLSIEELQTKLSPRQVLIEYGESDSNLFVFAITKTDFWIDELENDSLLANSIDQYIKSFDPLLIQKEFSSHFPQFAASARNLYARLLHPIVQKLPTSIDHLILIPTNKLSYAPWGLFVHGQGDAQGKDYKSLNYLLNDYSVSYAHSASLLFQGISTKSSNANQSVLAFAPSYDENSAENYTNLASVFRDELTPLKWNVSEVDEIKKHFKGSYQTGLNATEKFFKETAAEHSILHLAIHAFVDDKNLMLSRLIFYQDNDSIEDGMLHAYELFNLDLSAEMAVLSACKTGLEEVQEGEGIMSLGRAFSYAGCPSIVTNHWSVDDQSTSQVMGSFYKYLADGQTKDKALRQAKLDFLQSTNGLKTHPYYWGSFVVLGDTKSLSSGTNMIFIIFAVIMVIVPVVVWANLRKTKA